MKTWQIVLLVLLGIYAVGVLVAGAYLRGANWKIAFLWPLFVLWALLGGNIQ